MKINFLTIFFSTLLFNACIAQTAQREYGPVFDDIGPTFKIENLDYVPDSSAQLKAIFDIDYMPKDSLASNSLISSLHRFLNMHVKSGIPESNISLAFVLHGASTKDAMTDEAYQKKYGIKNPNTNLIETLAQHGVDMYICGQSASYAGITKSDLLPDIKLALSAMTVLTIYQSEGYSLIKF